MECEDLLNQIKKWSIGGGKPVEKKREEISRQKYVGDGVCKSVSESLMWASEALMLGFLDSLRKNEKKKKKGKNDHPKVLV